MFICEFFFFSSRRRHTRYIGDWSSDVCSSDLSRRARSRRRRERARLERITRTRRWIASPRAPAVRRSAEEDPAELDEGRSEERRVGKEWRAGGAQEYRAHGRRKQRKRGAKAGT